MPVSSPNFIVFLFPLEYFSNVVLFFFFGGAQLGLAWNLSSSCASFLGVGIRSMEHNAGCDAFL